MLEVINNSLVFTIPEVHPEARLCLDFQRTFRIPEKEAYNLPPGLGKYPLHILGSNELLIPMYQSEALWINVECGQYPFAIKATYESLFTFVVTKNQPWIDNLDNNGVPKQFVAPPLTVDPKQSDYCFALEIFPMKSDVYTHIPNEMLNGLWDDEHKHRVYIHLVNSIMWRSAGNEMCTIPLTESEYAYHGYPWLKTYEENTL